MYCNLYQLAMVETIPLRMIHRFLRVLRISRTDSKAPVLFPPSWSRESPQAPIRNGVTMPCLAVNWNGGFHSQTALPQINALWFWWKIRIKWMVPLWKAPNAGQHEVTLLSCGNDSHPTWDSRVASTSVIHLKASTSGSKSALLWSSIRRPQLSWLRGPWRPKNGTNKHEENVTHIWGFP